MFNPISGKNNILKYPNTVSLKKYLSIYLGRFTVILIKNKLIKFGKTSRIILNVFLKLKVIFSVNLKIGANVTNIPVNIFIMIITNKAMFKELKA
jgi:hypothetical protein